MSYCNSKSRIVTARREQKDFDCREGIFLSNVLTIYGKKRIIWMLDFQNAKGDGHGSFNRNDE